MILLIGPVLPPIHGQSLAFTRFIESIDEDKRILVNTSLEYKSSIGKIFGTLKTLLNITMKVIFSKYDTVYFTCSRSILGSIKDILLINLVSLKDVSIINHLHGSDFKEFLDKSPKWYKKILIKSYKKVNISIVLLDSMKEQFIDFPKMKVEIVPNFYDKELNENLEEKDDNKINIVYFSNIMSSKGIFELIDAFEILCKEYSNIYLNIAGEYIADEYMSIADVKEKFKNKIRHHDRIKYIGKVFGERKVRLLQKSDIFVLPSYYKSEAFPISIIEAMACMNAIVTTNYKYLPEVIFSENGVIVEPKSVNSLVDGIKNLIIDKKKLKQIQIYNHQVAKKKYSLEQYIDNLNKIVMEN
ncbi:MAG: glycosyltransferase family 4 protein [Arcobacter sp.]|uniref:glycosyltransferase family 4 protein n=1 Tax=Arcobacter sp. TaxID=1872629 RepID=UPI003D01E01B